MSGGVLIRMMRLIVFTLTFSLRSEAVMIVGSWLVPRLLLTSECRLWSIELRRVWVMMSGLLVCLAVRLPSCVAKCLVRWWEPMKTKAE